MRDGLLLGGKEREVVKNEWRGTERGCEERGLRELEGEGKKEGLRNGVRDEGLPGERGGCGKSFAAFNPWEAAWITAS